MSKQSLNGISLLWPRSPTLAKKLTPSWQHDGSSSVNTKQKNWSHARTPWFAHKYQQAPALHGQNAEPLKTGFRTEPWGLTAVNHSHQSCWSSIAPACKRGMHCWSKPPHVQNLSVSPLPQGAKAGKDRRSLVSLAVQDEIVRNTVDGRNPKQPPGMVKT